MASADKHAEAGRRLYDIEEHRSIGTSMAGMIPAFARDRPALILSGCWVIPKRDSRSGAKHWTWRKESLIRTAFLSLLATSRGFICPGANQSWLFVWSND